MCWGLGNKENGRTYLQLKNGATGLQLSAPGSGRVQKVCERKVSGPPLPEHFTTILTLN